jgi:hypothetical protein
VIGVPPLEDGAVQVSVIPFVTPFALVSVGGPGVVQTVAARSAEAEPSPTAFVAVTV